jgi:hypothetical protein
MENVCLAMMAGSQPMADDNDDDDEVDDPEALLFAELHLLCFILCSRAGLHGDSVACSERAIPFRACVFLSHETIGASRFGVLHVL